MAYWKFLRAGARSPFTGFQWADRVGTWVTAAAGDPCVQGIHACRADQLPHWISDELWEIELGEPVLATARKVVASRARLVRRVEAWDARAAQEFAGACVDRLAHHAAEELGAAGLDAAARELGAARPAALESGDLTDLREAATHAAQDALRQRQAHVIAMYLIDAIDGAAEYPAASIGYIAARAANQRTTIAGDDPDADERRWQAAWLARRLTLTADG